MKYNMVLCHLNLGEEGKAISLVNQMNIDLDQPYYADYVNFKKFINNDHKLFKKEEVFPNRNKLSNFFDKITVIKDKLSFQMRLCIPFPKVEPPEIFP